MEMADKTEIKEAPEALARIPDAIIGDRNARGIPSALFVVRVPDIALLFSGF